MSRRVGRRFPARRPRFAPPAASDTISAVYAEERAVRPVAADFDAARGLAALWRDAGPGRLCRPAPDRADGRRACRSGHIWQFEGASAEGVGAGSAVAFKVGRASGFPAARDGREGTGRGGAAAPRAVDHTGAAGRANKGPDLLLG